MTNTCSVSPIYPTTTSLWPVKISFIFNIHQKIYISIEITKFGNIANNIANNMTVIRAFKNLPKVYR